MKALTNYTVARWLLPLSLVFFILTSCKKEPEQKQELQSAGLTNPGERFGNISPAMVLTWNEAGTQAIANMTPIVGVPLPPMPESRIYAMINVAMHDALNNIVPKYQTYALNNARDKDADPNAAVAQAAHDVIAAQLPPQQAFADALLTTSLASIADGGAATEV